MSKSKIQTEIERQIKIANYHTIINMSNDGWCNGCKENIDNCLARGKCKGQEELENGKKTV